MFSTIALLLAAAALLCHAAPPAALGMTAPPTRPPMVTTCYRRPITDEAVKSLAQQAADALLNDCGDDDGGGRLAASETCQGKRRIVVTDLVQVCFVYSGSSGLARLIVNVAESTCPQRRQWQQALQVDAERCPPHPSGRRLWCAFYATKRDALPHSAAGWHVAPPRRSRPPCKEREGAAGRFFF